MKAGGAVLVLAEINRGQLHPNFYECISAAREIAEVSKVQICILAIGSGLDQMKEGLQGFGAEKIYFVDDPALELYHPEKYTSVLVKIVNDLEPGAVLAGLTLTTGDLAPRAAFALDAPLINDCVGIKIQEGKPLFMKPVYSGNVLASFEALGDPVLLTIRSGAFPEASKGAGDSEFVNIEAEIAGEVKLEIIERHDDEDVPQLTSAKVVVSGGRGIGGAEGFQHLQRLSEALDGAVGASRPPCDLGWVSPQLQVGQTGEIIRPDIYVAIGISGATQHLAGMSGSKTIVAINKDREANILKVADYGVIGRYEDILPSFVETLENLKK